MTGESDPPDASPVVLETVRLEGIGEVQIVRTWHDDEVTNFAALLDGRRIAKVFTMVKPDHLLLCDVMIQPRVTRAVRVFGVPVWRWSVSLRGHSLGTRLVRHVIAEARSRGLPEVNGMFAPERTEDSESLGRFYRRLGFEVGGGRVRYRVL